MLQNWESGQCVNVNVMALPTGEAVLTRVVNLLVGAAALWHTRRGGERFSGARGVGSGSAAT